MLPFFVELSNTKSLDSSYQFIANQMMGKAYQSDIKLEANTLTGSSNFSITGQESYIVLNPLEKNVSVSGLIPLIEFKKNNIKVSIFGAEIFNKTYQELALSDIDFAKIMKNDYKEMDKFFSAINKIFLALKPAWVAKYIISNFLYLFGMVLIFPALLVLIFYGYKADIPAKNKYKIFLDCQYITILFGLFAMMVAANFFLYLGLIISVIYAYLALKSIVAVKVVVKKDEGGNVNG